MPWLCHRINAGSESAHCMLGKTGDSSPINRRTSHATPQLKPAAKSVHGCEQVAERPFMSLLSAPPVRERQRLAVTLALSIHRRHAIAADPVVAHGRNRPSELSFHDLKIIHALDTTVSSGSRPWHIYGIFKAKTLGLNTRTSFKPRGPIHRPRIANIISQCLTGPTAALPIGQAIGVR